MNSDADAAPPRKLTPAFYGCYDWHSSVHGHWLLARLVRTFPDAPFAKPARAALRKSLTAENLKLEAAYLREKNRTSFERPYGLAWFLQLCVELREWDDPDAKEMSEEDWQQGFAKSLGVFLNGASIQRPGEHGERVRDDSFYVVFNAHHEPLQFTLPPQQFAGRWMQVLDTASDAPPELRRSRRAKWIKAGEQIEVQARALVLLRAAD